MEQKLIVCIDIGGTHISAAIIDYASMRIIKESYNSSLIDSNADLESILYSWSVAIDQSIRGYSENITAMLVSIPGPFDYDKGISLMDGMHKYQSLLNFNVKAYFAKRFNLFEQNIHFFNDAHAFLLGEVYHYTLEKERIIGLTLGTGLGSALYDGSEVKDLNYGSARYLNGIVEDYISTRGILTHLESLGIGNLKGVKHLVENENLLKERKLAFDFLIEHLGRFIKDYILPLKPEKIIIGGSIAKSHSLFLQQLQTKIKTEILIASFDELNLFFGMTSKAKL